MSLVSGRSCARRCSSSLPLRTQDPPQGLTWKSARRRFPRACAEGERSEPVPARSAGRAHPWGKRAGAERGEAARAPAIGGRTHQAADELAGPASGTAAEGPAIGPPTQIAKPVVPTKPGLGPAPAPADGLALSLGEADVQAVKRETRRLDTAALEAPRVQREPSSRRTWLFAIVALAIAVLLLVFLLPREPNSEQAVSPSAAPSASGPSAATSVGSAVPTVSAEPSVAEPESTSAVPDAAGSVVARDRPTPKTTAEPRKSPQASSAAPPDVTSPPTTTTPPPTPSSDLIFDMDKKR